MNQVFTQSYRSIATSGFHPEKKWGGGGAFQNVEQKKRPKKKKKTV